MADNRLRTGCLVGGGAALLVVIVAVVLGAVLWSRTRGTTRQIRDQYAELSATSQARGYERAPDPPGWSLQPGEAAVLYQQAWGACDLQDLPDDVLDSLDAALRAWTGDPLRGPTDPVGALEAAGSHPVWGQCRNAGVPDLEDDLVIAQLTPDTCDLYAGCWPALDALRRGSRRADTRSPVHLWSSWSAEDGGSEYRSLIPFLRLADLELLAGYLAGLHGDPWAPAESALTVLRYGHDVGQGSGLLGTMVGVAIQNQGADAVAALVTRDRLAGEDRARLAAELHYVNRHTFSVAEAVEAEFLTLGSLWVHDDLPVPPTALLPVGEMGLGERMVMTKVADDHLTLVDELLPALDAPFPERIAAYEDLMERLDDAWSMPDYLRYDVRLTATRARLLLLEIAAADGAFRATHGRAPADLDELAAAYPDLPRTDPLTLQDFVLTTGDGHRLLRSPALDADGDPARLGEIATSLDTEAMLQLELAAE